MKNLNNAMNTIRNAMSKANYEVLRDFGYQAEGDENIRITMLPQNEEELKKLLVAIEDYTEALNKDGTIVNTYVICMGDSDLFKTEDDSIYEWVKESWNSYFNNVPEWAGINKDEVISFVNNLILVYEYSNDEAMSLALNGLVYSIRYGYNFQ